MNKCIQVIKCLKKFKLINLLEELINFELIVRKFIGAHQDSSSLN